MGPFSNLELVTDIWFVVKIMFLIGMGLYLIFAFVIIRQTHHMTNTLQVGFETPIRLFAWLHLFAAIGLLLFAIFVL